MPDLNMLMLMFGPHNSRLNLQLLVGGELDLVGGELDLVGANSIWLGANSTWLGANSTWLGANSILFSRSGGELGGGELVMGRNRYKSKAHCIISIWQSRK